MEKKHKLVKDFPSSYKLVEIFMISLHNSALIKMWYGA